MRLWLDVPGMRPDVPKIQLYEYEDGRGGIDPQKGGFVLLPITE